MLSESELAELLDIRRKIDTLQMRYNELAAKMAMPPSAAPAAAPVAAPTAPAPVPVATPQPVRVSPPAAAYAQPVRQAVPAAELPPGELETKRFSAATPRPAAASAVPKDPASWTLKDHIVDVLAKAGRPVSFEDVYKRLEDNKAPLPKDKPKLVVRQILYNKAQFEVIRGSFALVEGPGTPAAQPVPQKNPAVSKTPPGDLFKHRLDAMLGKK